MASIWGSYAGKAFFSSEKSERFFIQEALLSQSDIFLIGLETDVTEETKTKFLDRKNALRLSSGQAPDAKKDNKNLGAIPSKS